MLRQKILNREMGIITYGITPPKQNNTKEKVWEISQKQVERIKNLTLDGLILYDIQDETDRIDGDRPFPFLHTIDPAFYANTYLKELTIPKIIYRCVGKYAKHDFADWLSATRQQDCFSVFVGASSGKQQVQMSLHEAYQLRKEQNPDLLLGGVVIPERHMKHENEHLRIIGKIEDGCQFFVSQAVYNVEAAKNFLSDYYYYCAENELEMVPILINLTPCGSMKTLEFMKWLGINIPKWLENDLMHSQDILDKSVSLSKEIFQELLDFAKLKKIPLGCSIESVSTRKIEIEASIELAKEVSQMFTKKS